MWQVLFEGNRRLETRLKEHIDACEKSAIAEHAWVEGHRILWEEASIVDRARSQTDIRSETPRTRMGVWIFMNAG